MRYYPEDDPDFRGEDASQEESAFQKQAWFVIGIACLLCAGMILYSMFFTDPWVGGEGRPTGSFLPGKRRFGGFPGRRKAGFEHRHPGGTGSPAGNRPGAGTGHPPIPGGIRAFLHRGAGGGGRRHRGGNPGRDSALYQGGDRGPAFPGGSTVERCVRNWTPCRELGR